MICLPIKSGSTLYRWTHTCHTCMLAFVTDEDLEQFSECMSLIGGPVWEAETWSALHRLN